MENENTEVMGNQTETETTGSENENITLTADELAKRIQSETDKVRTKYSKEIKELKAKIEELTPEQKSQTEIDLENRLKALEERERKMALNESLTAQGLSTEFGGYLKDDTDIETFSKFLKGIIDEEVSKRVKNDNYKPDNHKSGDSITKEEFDKMGYGERTKLFNENPDLYQYLSGRKFS